MKKIMVLSLMLCLISSLFAMQPARNGWNGSYEQRCVGLMCVSLYIGLNVVAIGQEMAAVLPITVGGHVVPPVSTGLLCGCLAPLFKDDHSADHSCCCASLRCALGKRVRVQAPQAQKME